jgi:hypothetical protein
MHDLHWSGVWLVYSVPVQACAIAACGSRASAMTASKSILLRNGNALPAKTASVMPAKTSTRNADAAANFIPII